MYVHRSCCQMPSLVRYVMPSAGRNFSNPTRNELPILAESFSKTMMVSGRMFLCTNCELCTKRTELVSCLARSKRLLSGQAGSLSIRRVRRLLGFFRDGGMEKRNLKALISCPTGA
jgi:hypothetical protein